MQNQKSFFTIVASITVPSLSLYLIYKAFSIIVDPMDKTTVVRVFILLSASFIAGWVSCYMLLKTRIESQHKTPKINLPYSGPKIESPDPVRTIPFNNRGKAQTLIMSESAIDLASAQHNIGVSLKYLIRFANMPYPSRSYWTGDTTAYTKAKDFFLQSGTLVQEGQKFRWADGVRAGNLVSWLEKTYT